MNDDLIEDLNFIYDNAPPDNYGALVKGVSAKAITTLREMQQRIEELEQKLKLDEVIFKGMK